MKILITTEWYAPVINGVVTSVRNLERELRARGHEVKILTLSDKAESYTDGDVTYLASLSAGLVYPQARVAFHWNNEEIQKLMAWHPDLIHSQCEFSTFLIARRIARELQIPIVHTYHTVYEDYTHYFSPVKKWGRAMVSAFSRKVLSYTSCVIVPTEKVKNILLRYGVSEEIRVVPTGIDMGKYSRILSQEERMEMRQRLGISQQEKVAVFVGRLAKEKNLDEILSMISHTRPEHFKLLIVGDGPCREELEKRTDEWNLRDRVIFTGMIAPDEIYKYYQTGDFFVSASTSETQGLTYVEALANGLPALCRKDDCLTGVIEDGVNGWQYENDREFMEKVDFLLDPENGEVCRKLSAAAREGVFQRYSSSQFAKTMEEVYQHVLHEARESVQEGAWQTKPHASAHLAKTALVSLIRTR